MDKEAFGRMVIRNEQQIYRIAKSILQNDEDCADAAQEAIARAFTALPTLKNDAYAKTWFIRILIHAAFDILKKQNYQEWVCDEELLNRPYERQDYSDLYDAILSLPEDYRVVVVMHYIEGYRVREIAEIMDLSEGTVKTRLRRGRQVLKSFLEEDSPPRRSIKVIGF